MDKRVVKQAKDTNTRENCVKMREMATYSRVFYAALIIETSNG